MKMGFNIKCIILEVVDDPGPYVSSKIFNDILLAETNLKKLIRDKIRFQYEKYYFRR